MRTVKLLISLLLLTAVFASSLFVLAMNSNERLGPSIIVQDFPDSPFIQFAGKIFPKTLATYQAGILDLEKEGSRALILMPENQALPLLETRQSANFKSFYRASIVIVTDTKRREEPVGAWSDLSRAFLGPSARIGLFVEPELLLGALQVNTRQSTLEDEVLEQLALFQRRGQLLIYNHSMANRPFPTAAFDTKLPLNERRKAQDALPQVMIMFDYQAAQLNRGLPEDRFRMAVPLEGSMYQDYGLYTASRSGTWLLAEQSGSFFQERNDGILLQYGYRLPNGKLPVAEWQEPSSGILKQRTLLGYPDSSDYDRVRRIRNNLEFNGEVIQLQSRFKRVVLGDMGALPDNPQVYLLLFLGLTLILLLWLTSIYYRLDEKCLKAFSLPFAALYGIWMMMRLVNVLESRSGPILYYVSIIPILLMLLLFFYAAVTLAVQRNYFSRAEGHLTLFLIAPTLLFGFLLLTNTSHGLIFEIQRSSYNSDIIFHPEPLFYLMLIFFVTVLLSALIILKRAQYLESGWRSLALPLFIVGALLIYNYLYFIWTPWVKFIDFHLLNAVGIVAFLEACIRSRLLPANWGYFQLFRHSPNHMRLLDLELREMYLPKGLEPMKEGTFSQIRREILAQKRRNQREQAGNAPFALRAYLEEWFRDKDKRTVHKTLRVQDPDREDILYGIKELSSAYLIWDEDRSEVKALADQLGQLRAQLAKQKRFLEKEQIVQSELLAVQIRQQLLGDIEASLAEHMTEIRDSLKLVKEKDAEGDLSFVRQELARVKIVVSQCKRKSNLLVRSETALQAEEVELIIREALNDATTAGIDGFVTRSGSAEQKIEAILLFYDYLQFLLKKCVGLPEVNLLVNLQCREQKFSLRLLLTCDRSLSEDFFKAPASLQERMDQGGVVFYLEDDGSDWSIDLSITRGEDGRC